MENKLVKIAENIQKVHDTSHSKGYTSGYASGHIEGEKSEYDRFWDSYQNNGNRANYRYGFAGDGWDDETFKPKYDIISAKNTSANYLFGYSKITDFCKALEDCNVVLDTSNSNELTDMFRYSSATKVPTINTIGANEVSRVFYHSYNLKTIEKLVFRSDGSQSGNSLFTRCDSLENITVEGTIGKINVNVSACSKLTHDSLISILNALKDFVTDGSSTTQTLSLGTTNLEKLTDSEKAIATQKGWTLA